jgi:ParB-like chromosome segregation protein Spo0J
MSADAPITEIPITCKGQVYVPLEELNDFQGDLKKMSPESLARCRESILQIGFSFPVLVWGRSILDGHQRLRVVRELLAEGRTIGDIPVVEIEAKNEREAAEKLLALGSRYGEITDTGLSNFIDTYGVDIEEIASMIELPEIDLEDFLATFGEDIVPEGLPAGAPEDLSQFDKDVVVKLMMGPELWSEHADMLLGRIKEALGEFNRKVKIKVQE